MEHNEHTYFEDQIASMYYYLTGSREKHDKMSSGNLLSKNNIYAQLLCSLLEQIKTAYAIDTTSRGGISENTSRYISSCKLLYKLVAQTRDIYNGKGERDLTYMMIYTWWKYAPTMGLIMLRAILFSGGDTIDKGINLLYIDTERPYVPHRGSYGCFKDVKHFCAYVHTYGDKNDIICRYAMIMLNQRIYDDYKEYKKNGMLPTLACKWVPREKSKHGWMFEKMAIQWAQATCPYILSGLAIDGVDIHAYNEDISLTRVKVITKCKTMYRKVISFLTKLVDIPETKKCENRWADIDPAKITVRDWVCNKNALFNIDNTFRERENTMIDKDRRECSHKIKEHIFISQVSPDMGERDRGKHIGNEAQTLSRSSRTPELGTSVGCRGLSGHNPMHFVKQAIHIIRNKNMGISSETVSFDNKLSPDNPRIQHNLLYQTTLLNNEWEMFSRRYSTLDSFIPILDVSLSMCGDPLYNAMGLCCLIAEKSKIEHRVMVMDNIPTWVNLTGCSSFVEMVEVLYSYTTKNTIANLERTFDGVIQALTARTPTFIPKPSVFTDNLVFVVFTNEECFRNYENNTFHSIIVDKFLRENLPIPHIVYWNCSPTLKNMYDNGPVMCNTKRVSMVSGTNAEMINHFSFIGLGEQYESTPIETVKHILNAPRYLEIDRLFDSYFSIETLSRQWYHR